MKKGISAKIKLVAAAFQIGVVGCVIMATNSSSSYAKVNQIEHSAAIYDGAAVYTKYCARCHGGDGQAKTAKGKQTNATDLTKSRIANAAGVKVITNGKELMPGFKANLNADEIQGVMTYVKGFRK